MECRIARTSLQNVARPEQMFWSSRFGVLQFLRSGIDLSYIMHEIPFLALPFTIVYFQIDTRVSVLSALTSGSCGRKLGVPSLVNKPGHRFSMYNTYEESVFDSELRSNRRNRSAIEMDHSYSSRKFLNF